MSENTDYNDKDIIEMVYGYWFGDIEYAETTGNNEGEDE